MLSYMNGRNHNAKYVSFPSYCKGDLSRHVKRGRTKKTHGLNIAESVYASVYVQSM